jgi:hypothetical protein
LIGKMAKERNMTPTGKCWCGCGEAVPEESYFARGHDKAAEAMLTKLLYGPRHSVAAFLADNGYGGHGLNLKAAYAATEERSALAWVTRRAGKATR